MKGLVLKDFYLLKKHYSFAIFIMILTLCSLFSANLTSVALALGVMLPLIISMTIFLGVYSTCSMHDIIMPCSRADVVSSKYIMSIAVSVLSVTVCAARGAFPLAAGSIGFGEYLARLMLCTFLASSGGIVLVILFKYGQKVWNFLFLLIAGVASFLAVESILSFSELSGKALKLPEISFGKFFCGLAAVAAIYALSWRFSIAAYNKRDLS